MKTRASFLLALVCFAGCAAQRPLLYPNEQFSNAGPMTVDQDIDECRHRADAAVESTRVTETARSTVISSGIGAASGAVGGAIFGAPGTGAAVGAVSAATAALLHGALNAGAPSPTYQGYVSACLAERGYQVAGWQ